MKKHLIALLCLTLALLMTGCGEKSEAFSFPDEGREYIDTAEWTAMGELHPSGIKRKDDSPVWRSNVLMARPTSLTYFPR